MLYAFSRLCALSERDRTPTLSLTTDVCERQRRICAAAVTTISKGLFEGTADIARGLAKGEFLDPRVVYIVRANDVERHVPNKWLVSQLPTAGDEHREGIHSAFHLVADVPGDALGVPAFVDAGKADVG